MTARAALLLVLVSLPAAADEEPPAMDPEAKAHLKRGAQLVRRQKYAEAIAELRAGQAIDPHPFFFFPLAQAYRLSGDCPSALPLYQQAIEAAPERERLIRGVMKLCPASPPPTEPVPEPPPRPPPPSLPPPSPASSPPPIAEPPPPPPDSRPFYLDPIGDSLALSGLIVAGVGVGFLMAAANTEASLRTPNPELRYDVFLERADKADRERFLGILATSIGGALVAGAVVRWVIVADAGPDRVGVAFLRSF